MEMRDILFEVSIELLNIICEGESINEQHQHSHLDNWLSVTILPTL
jgi:hypothetical protein